MFMVAEPIGIGYEPTASYIARQPNNTSALKLAQRTAWLKPRASITD
jgi:hypothetical protein